MPFVDLITILILCVLLALIFSLMARFILFRDLYSRTTINIANQNASLHLPRPGKDYVSRQINVANAIETLRNDLVTTKDHQAMVIILHGRGGVGKSWIAGAFVEQQIKDDNSFRVASLSFDPVRTDYTFDDFILKLSENYLDELPSAFDKNSYTQDELEKCGKWIQSQIAEKASLLVVENLYCLSRSDQRATISFILACEIPTLITTREYINSVDENNFRIRNYLIDSMTKEEFKSLVALYSRSKLDDKNIFLTAKDINDCTEASMGNPLVGTWMLNRISVGEQPKDVFRYSWETSDDITERVIAQTLKSQSFESAKGLLLGFSLFPGKASPSDVQKLLNVTKNELGQALQVCMNFGLLQKTEDGNYSIHDECYRATRFYALQGQSSILGKWKDLPERFVSRSLAATENISSPSLQDMCNLREICDKANITDKKAVIQSAILRRLEEAGGLNNNLDGEYRILLGQMGFLQDDQQIEDLYLEELGKIASSGYFIREIDKQTDADWRWLPKALQRLSRRFLIKENYRNWAKASSSCLSNNLNACNSLAKSSKDVLCLLDEKSQEISTFSPNLVMRFQCDFILSVVKLFRGEKINLFEFADLAKSHDSIKNSLDKDVESAFERLKKLVESIQTTDDSQTVIKKSEIVFFDEEINHV